MGLADDLKEEVKGIFSETWEVSEAQVVPDPESLKLSNDARHFERATILYADLSGSTNLVDKYHWKKAGKIYKSYLACAARIIRSLGGEITAYDGIASWRFLSAICKQPMPQNALLRSIGP